MEVCQESDSAETSSGTAMISVDTVKRHVTHVLNELGASNRTQAVSRARDLGLLE
jgi:DNA-binding NarL/FixJ family response regulator